MLSASTPELATDAKRKLFDARTSLEVIWLDDGDEILYEAMRLLPHDRLHYEQLISSADGQAVVRANISKARELLQLMEGK